MDYPLVSIITPCYNGERFIQRYINCILSQDYPNIELILINDGSTDNTEKIILSNEKGLIEKGIKLKYIYQENSGPSGAINQGLKLFQGKYMTWPDSDDLLDCDYIGKKVNFLELNPGCSLVISKIRIVLENNLEKPIGIIERRKPEHEDNFFNDMIFGRNCVYNPGAFMVRSDCFFHSVGRKIYSANKESGQNYQLLMPVLYHCKYDYLDEILYTYVKRPDSLSRSKVHINPYNDKISKADRKFDIMSNIFKSMRFLPNDYEIYLELLRYETNRTKMIASFHFGQRQYCYFCFKEIYKYASFTEKIFGLSSKYKVTYLLLKHILKMTRGLRKNYFNTLPNCK